MGVVGRIHGSGWELLWGSSIANQRLSASTVTQRAIALIAAMTEPQRVCQALAYCVWLGYHGLGIDLATVLAAWEGS